MVQDVHYTAVCMLQMSQREGIVYPENAITGSYCALENGCVGYDLVLLGGLIDDAVLVQSLTGIAMFN